MDFVSFIEQNCVPIIVIECLIVGYILKMWVEDINNKFIPTILFFIGGLTNLIVSGFSISSFIMGAAMGLASTGLHQAFKQWIENKK